MAASREAQAQRRERVARVEKMLALGTAKSVIIAKLADDCGVAERTIRKDILKVEASWAEESEAEGYKHLRRNQTRQLLQAIVRNAMDDKAYSAAVSAVSRLMELDGLKVLKVEHSEKPKRGIEHMTSNEKRKELARLMGIANEVAREQAIRRAEREAASGAS